MFLANGVVRTLSIHELKGRTGQTDDESCRSTHVVVR